MSNINPELFKIFVFGTLKEGFPNFYLNKGIKQEGCFQTLKAYLFYLIGERYSPCVIENTHHHKDAKCIFGELYLVTLEQLNVLDTLERTQQANGYSRQQITVKNTKTGTLIDAYIYLKSPQQIEPSDINIGPINCYLKQHAALYKPKR